MIKNKLILTLTVFIILMLIVFTAIALILINIDIERQTRITLEKQLDDLIQFTQNAYIVPLWNYDYEATKELNNALLLHEKIVGLNIYLTDTFYSGLIKNFFNDSYSVITLREPVDLSSFSEISQKKLEVEVVSIDRDGVDLGKLELFYTDYFIKKDMKQRSLNTIYGNAIIAFAMIILIYFFISKYFIKPILKLSKEIKNVAEKKDYSIRLSAKTKNEIGLLYEGFNYMLKNIQQKEDRRDILEKEISRTKFYLSSIIESMPSILFAADKNLNITLWNQSAAENFGISTSRIIGKNIRNIPEVSNDFFNYFNDVLEKREPLFLAGKKIASDEKKIFNVSIYPLYSETSEGIVFRADDITELEQKEKQLIQVQKMETIGTLAGGIAHDFNNILVGIIGTVSLIKFKLQQRKKISEEDISEYLDVLEKSSERASDMVQQLLSLSRRKELTFAPVDLNKSIKNVKKICESSFEKSVEIVMDLFKKEAIAQADPTQIEQVFLNLCINGYHAMTIMRKQESEQGGTLRLKVDKIIADRFFCMIHNEAEKKTYWRVTVSDTGVGMDEDVQSHIYDPFFTTKAENQGTGLGMSMVFNIVKQHKGFITVYSEVNIGTSFNIYLPLWEREVDTYEEKILEKMESLSGTVLLADDEPTIRSIAKQMLETTGLNVILAKDGVEAVELYRSNKKIIDFIILDLVMPKKSVLEIYDELKKENDKLKIIISSGFDGDKRVNELIERGAAGFIQKPYTLSNLIKKLKEFL